MLLNNIDGHYLINGKEFPNIDPWLVKKGDLLRVRMINISPIEVAPDALPRPLHEGDRAGRHRTQRTRRTRGSRTRCSSRPGRRSTWR